MPPEKSSVAHSLVHVEAEEQWIEAWGMEHGAWEKSGCQFLKENLPPSLWMSGLGWRGMPGDREAVLLSLPRQRHLGHGHGSAEEDDESLPSSCHMPRLRHHPCQVMAHDS